MWTDNDIEGKRPIETATLPLPAKLMALAFDSTDDENDYESIYSSDLESFVTADGVLDEDWPEERPLELDRWERASRSWLGNGTIFLLLIIYHVLQIRSDVRRLVTTTNDHMHHMCSAVDEKSRSIQAALSLSVHDLHPLACSFLGDVATRMRSVVLYTSQLIGGRVRELIKAVCSDKICLVVGMLIGVQEFLVSADTSGPQEPFVKEGDWRDTHPANRKVKWIKNKKGEARDRDSNGAMNRSAFAGGEFAKPGALGALINSLGGGVWLEDFRKSLKGFIDWTVEFITHPELFIQRVIERLLEEGTDMAVTLAVSPDASSRTMLCARMQRVNFNEINTRVQNHLKLLVGVLIVLLVIFNYIEFVRHVERKPVAHVGPAESCAKKQKPSGWLKSHIIAWAVWPVPCARLRKALHWLLLYLSYPQLWMCLAMVLVGWLHARFHSTLKDQLREIQAHQINPILASWTKQARASLVTVVADLSVQWKEILACFLEPFKRLLEQLRSSLTAIVDSCMEQFGEIFHIYENIRYYLQPCRLEESLFRVVEGMLDCFFMKRIRRFRVLLSELGRRVWGENGAEGIVASFGGLLRVFKDAIKGLWRRLRIGRAVKRALAALFQVLLRLIEERWGFGWIYWWLSVVLIVQALLMVLIRLLSGCD